MQTPKSLFVLVALIWWVTACAPATPTPQEQSDARMTDAVTATLQQSNAQQDQLLADLRLARQNDLAHINTLREQNITLVAQMAIQQQTLTVILQDTIHAQNNLILLLTVLVGILILALIALAVINLRARHRRVTPREYVLPPARGFGHLPNGQVIIVQPHDMILSPHQRDQ